CWIFEGLQGKVYRVHFKMSLSANNSFLGFIFAISGILKHFVFRYLNKSSKAGFT
ncbi:MAG: hypothetical protein ACI81W_004173, partial [Saprospiraceae bacterium]